MEGTEDALRTLPRGFTSLTMGPVNQPLWPTRAGGGLDGGVGRGDIGREKLTEDLLLTSASGLCDAVEVPSASGASSRRIRLRPGVLGVGARTLIGEDPALLLRLWVSRFWGRAGIIEPELACLRTPGGLAAPPEAPDAVEPFLCMRLVCTLATGTGVVECDRKAAAAAADERSPFEDLLFRNAWLAASAAFGEGVVFCGGPETARRRFLNIFAMNEEGAIRVVLA